jgi:transcriptional regulator with XRE-family HTH domain
MEHEAKRLGTRIKEVRRARRLTQEKLSEKAGISTRYLSRLEVGKQTPSIDTLVKIAKGLSIEVWELYDFAPHGTVKELKAAARKLLDELDEQKLRLVIKIVRAIAR